MNWTAAIMLFTHATPEPRGFDSTAIVDTEKCAVVGNDNFRFCHQ